MKNKECYENELVVLHFVALQLTNMMPVYLSTRYKEQRML